MSLKRNAWVFVLALALSGAMVAGCGDEEDGNDGGSGGTGGTGGTGGGTPECTANCNEGETCIERGAVDLCRCEEDSCPAGQLCNDDQRCETEPVVMDFAPCTEAGAEKDLPDGFFLCTDFPQTGGELRWLRLCAAAGDCKASETFCLGEVLGYGTAGPGASFCYSNLCDVGGSLGPAGDPPLAGNGVSFGGCDANDGVLDEGEAPTGVCLALGDDPKSGDPIGICIRSGSVPAGGDCESDAYKDEANKLCAADSICLNNSPAEPRIPCTSDAACAEVPLEYDPTETAPGYCAKDGMCGVIGFCGDQCNSGTAGEAAHPDAGCADPTAECRPAATRNPVPETLVGYCVSDCTMFALDACPQYPGTQDRLCYPSFDATDELDGFCVPQTAAPKAVGAECDRNLPQMDCPDNAFCFQLLEGEPSKCWQWCNCQGGYDANGVCLDAAVNQGCAPSGYTCQWNEQLLPDGPIGICMPSQA